MSMPALSHYCLEEATCSHESQEDLSEDMVLSTTRSAKERSMDIYQIYLRDIRRYPLLEREEERELAVCFHERNDLEAALRLVTCNLRLVVKIAIAYQKHWMDNLMDLIQEGNAGLLQAVRKFDPYRGYKFSYYASFWIKAYVVKYIMDNWKLVKLGTTQAQRKLFFNLRQEKERLQAQGIEASAETLSKRFNVRESLVEEMDQRLNSWEVSLDTPVNEGSHDTKKTLIPCAEIPVDEQLASREARECLRWKFEGFRKKLRDTELLIFNQRLLAENPLTLQQIGNQLNISRERVRQIEVRLKEKLRVYLDEEVEDLDSLRESIIDV